MICPTDDQPCTGDHSEACADNCRRTEKPMFKPTGRLSQRDPREQRMPKEEWSLAGWLFGKRKWTGKDIFWVSAGISCIILATLGGVALTAWAGVNW